MNGRVAKRLRREAVKLAFAESRINWRRGSHRYPVGSARWIYKKFKREYSRKGWQTP